MATIVKFPEANTVYVGKGCLDLPANRGVDSEGNPVIISCWQLTDAEKAEVAVTGKVYLHLWAINPQPSYVNGHRPFEVKFVDN